MIDDKTGISAATAKSHKQVIWDLQALSCFHMAEEKGLESLAHTHMQGCNTLQSASTCMQVPTDLGTELCTNASTCQQILMRTHQSGALCCCLLFSPFVSSTLRQLSAELLRKQAGKQTHQQRGRGAVSLSSKAV